MKKSRVALGSSLFVERSAAAVAAGRADKGRFSASRPPASSPPPPATRLPRAAPVRPSVRLCAYVRRTYVHVGSVAFPRRAVTRFSRKRGTRRGARARIRSAERKNTPCRECPPLPSSSSRLSPSRSLRRESCACPACRARYCPRIALSVCLSGWSTDRPSVRPPCPVVPLYLCPSARASARARGCA